MNPWIDNSFRRYFTFWFATLANGGEPTHVLIENKDFYIKTKEAAMKCGPVREDSSLSKFVENQFQLVNA